MTSPSARLLVYVSGDLACIRISGRANFTSSIDFKTLVTGLMEKGFARYILDLSECVLMDSTFLGVLAGFGLKMNGAPDHASANRPIKLLNPNARITDLLDNLGVAHLFQTVNGNADMPGGLAPQAPVPEATPSREEVKLNCLEAHRILMAISPDNEAKFKEVARFLAEDLNKPNTGA